MFQEKCQDKGGYLAEVDDQMEDAFLSGKAQFFGGMVNFQKKKKYLKLLMQS